MNLKDRIWGEYDVNDDVLIELVKHPELERLKGISQFGLPFEYYPLPQFTRYEHSIGVMLLLQKLGASLEEKVAGLLHDISHTAFSHLVDWVIGTRKDENYQDLQHKRAISIGDLGQFLQKFGFSPDDIGDHKKYSLLEQPSPRLCADRIDYALREFRDWANPGIVDLCKGNLINYNGLIVFSSEESAKAFAYSYMKLQREHWGGAEWMLRWQLFSDTLQYAIKTGIVSMGDFKTNDRNILNMLENSNDDYIASRLKNLRNLKFFITENNPQYTLYKKFRYIDPAYIYGGKTIVLSESDLEYREFLELERVHNSKGHKISLA